MLVRVSLYLVCGVFGCTGTDGVTRPRVEVIPDCVLGGMGALVSERRGEREGEGQDQGQGEVRGEGQDEAQVESQGRSV